MNAILDALEQNRLVYQNVREQHTDYYNHKDNTYIDDVSQITTGYQGDFSGNYEIPGQLSWFPEPGEKYSLSPAIPVPEVAEAGEISFPAPQTEAGQSVSESGAAELLLGRLERESRLFSQEMGVL